MVKCVIRCNKGFSLVSSGKVICWKRQYKEPFCTKLHVLLLQSRISQGRCGRRRDEVFLGGNHYHHQFYSYSSPVWRWMDGRISRLVLRDEFGIFVVLTSHQVITYPSKTNVLFNNLPISRLCVRTPTEPTDRWSSPTLFVLVNEKERERSWMEISSSLENLVFLNLPTIYSLTDSPSSSHLIFICIYPVQIEGRIFS